MRVGVQLRYESLDIRLHLVFDEEYGFSLCEEMTKQLRGLVTL